MTAGEVRLQLQFNELFEQTRNLEAGVNASMALHSKAAKSMQRLNELVGNLNDRLSKTEGVISGKKERPAEAEAEAPELYGPPEA